MRVAAASIRDEGERAKPLAYDAPRRVGGVREIAKNSPNPLAHAAPPQRGRRTRRGDAAAGSPRGCVGRVGALLAGAREARAPRAFARSGFRARSRPRAAASPRGPRGRSAPRPRCRREAPADDSRPHGPASPRPRRAGASAVARATATRRASTSTGPTSTRRSARRSLAAAAAEQYHAERRTP